MEKRYIATMESYSRQAPVTCGHLHAEPSRAEACAKRLANKTGCRYVVGYLPVSGWSMSRFMRLLGRLEQAIDIEYTDDKGETTRRVIHPVRLILRDGVWTLAAVCDLRGDFRSFRLSRMRVVEGLA